MLEHYDWGTTLALLLMTIRLCACLSPGTSKPLGKMHLWFTRKQNEPPAGYAVELLVWVVQIGHIIAVAIFLLYPFEVPQSSTLVAARGTNPYMYEVFDNAACNDGSVGANFLSEHAAFMSLFVAFWFYVVVETMIAVESAVGMWSKRESANKVIEADVIGHIDDVRLVIFPEVVNAAMDNEGRWDDLFGDPTLKPDKFNAFRFVHNVVLYMLFGVMLYQAFATLGPDFCSDSLAQEYQLLLLCAAFMLAARLTGRTMPVLRVDGIRADGVTAFNDNAFTLLKRAVDRQRAIVIQSGITRTLLGIIMLAEALVVYEEADGTCDGATVKIETSHPSVYNTATWGLWLIVASFAMDFIRILVTTLKGTPADDGVSLGKRQSRSLTNLRPGRSGMTISRLATKGGKSAATNLQFV